MGNSPHAIPQALRFLASLPLLSTFHVCFLYNVQGLLVVFSGRNSEKYIYCIFPETQIRKLIINKDREGTKEQQKKELTMAFPCFPFFSKISAAENQL